MPSRRSVVPPKGDEQVKTLVWLRVLLVSAALLVTSVSHAQAPQVLLLGSRHAFNVMALAAYLQDPITKAAAPCSDFPTRFWSFDGAMGGGLVQALDSRAPLDARIAPHNGRIWVAWNAAAETIPPGARAVVCAYLSGDSEVNQRLFFGTNAGVTSTLNLQNTLPVLDAINCPSGTGLHGEHQVQLIDDTPNTLPCGVYLLINGVQFNGLVADIRPEDALYANTRGLLACNPPAGCATDKVKNGLGYIAPLERLTSSFTPTHNNFNAYAITGLDPISGSPVTPGAVLQLGATPVLFLVNVTQGANPGDFSQNVPNDILNEVVAQVFSASTDVNKIGSTRTCDVTGSLTLCSPLNILNASATAGAFNTTEFQLVRNKGTVLSQETGVDPVDNSSAACTTFPVTANCGKSLLSLLRQWRGSQARTRQRLRRAAGVPDDPNGQGTRRAKPQLQQRFRCNQRSCEWNRVRSLVVRRFC